MPHWLQRALQVLHLHKTTPEPDVEPDAATANTRRTGGVHGNQSGDAAGTTGPAPNDTFVGRVGGADAGYAEETGAEARSADSGSTQRESGEKP